MPAYAGFKNLQDYFDSRFVRDRTNQASVAEAIGAHRNYINAVYHGRLKPSKQRCDKISAHFNDDPHILRILVGHESPPPDLADQQLREIYDLARSLDGAQRREAIRRLRDLRDSNP